MNFLNDLVLRAYVRLQSFAAQEPVRLRAALTSAVLALGVLVPALAAQETAQTVGGVLAVVLPILVGEGARKRVTPVDEQ
ncbi:hypothetical protein ABT096_29750 [Streptomyces sp. NPDC002561]|uniref:hypothetical protein n=1 Tax=Streptomyces sp. NPDC002561 TaxID=3154418 RepID=UPI00332F129D